MELAASTRASTWKPVSNVLLAARARASSARATARTTSTTLDDPTATATYGRRYVFAQLDQTTLSANIRLNVSFTPTMSLQFYGQPLISTGRYRDVRSWRGPRASTSSARAPGAWTYDPATARVRPRRRRPRGRRRSQDFNFKSLRGNAVFRWEYRPGSTLYLVWTQQRTDDESDSEFDLGPSFRPARRAPTPTTSSSPS